MTVSDHPLRAAPQPRERPVPCAVCRVSTWNVDAYCDKHKPNEFTLRRVREQRRHQDRDDYYAELADEAKKEAEWDAAMVSEPEPIESYWDGARVDGDVRDPLFDGFTTHGRKPE